MTTPPTLTGGGVTLRPVALGDGPALLAILRTPEVARWWGGDDVDEGSWLVDDPLTVKFAVVVEDVVVGLVQYSEEADPMYRHAGIDIFIDPQVQRRGIGRAALRTIAGYLFSERGHHRIVIDPAAQNHRAISAYAAVGFRPVGVLREYERNPDGTGWHDGLLMELLVSELI
ncbi:aminoglycoside 6'-N-acetyltransferase [Nakamurella sp. UYEF19]|uniref:GNAT family N-acetyltransferase n=1 Tax=Nakamurella sp. UYEF19 TaxID=1756392 RepID=UPI00339A1540